MVSASVARCGCLPATSPDAGLGLFQINGVDMTEARHDQAVALLTATSPTITLLVEREAAAALPSEGDQSLGQRVRVHSPPTPTQQGSPPEESCNSHPPQALESQFPVEVGEPCTGGHRQGWEEEERGCAALWYSSCPAFGLLSWAKCDRDHCFPPLPGSLLPPGVLTWESLWQHAGGHT